MIQNVMIDSQIMSQWGARLRNRKRRRLMVNHTFDSVKNNVKRKTLKLKTQKIEKQKAIDKHITRLHAVNKTLMGINDIHKLRDNQAQIEKLKDEMQFILDDKPFEEFVELVTPLLGESQEDTHITVQQKHTIFLNIFHKDKAIPCFVEREICGTCNKEFVMVSQESIMMCPTCGESEHLIYCNSDFIDSIDVKNNPYERGPLYRKYLMQFHADAPIPPPDVINVVYKHLSKVHIMLSTKVKPTPIAQILREEKLQKWTPYAVRIAKYINKEPIVS
jgi:hypothetical protein